MDSTPPPAIEIVETMEYKISCCIDAAIEYKVPADILLAVAEIEGGKPGQRVLNTNGTYDVGTMQFNTSYLKELEQYGITEEDVSYGCYAYSLAAWRISQHLKNDDGDIWTKAANYHSKTQRFNSIYRRKLIVVAQKWAEWLEEHFSTTSETYNPDEKN